MPTSLRTATFYTSANLFNTISHWGTLLVWGGDYSLSCPETGLESMQQSEDIFCLAWHLLSSRNLTGKSQTMPTKGKVCCTGQQQCTASRLPALVSHPMNLVVLSQDCLLFIRETWWRKSKPTSPVKICSFLFVCLKTGKHMHSL